MLRQPFYHVALAIVVLLFPGSALAHPELEKLECVALLTSPGDRTEEKTGPSRRELEDALLVAVKAKIPRIRIDRSCENSLFAEFVLADAKSKAGQSRGYYGYVQLSVFRRALIVEVGQVRSTSVWSIVETIIGGEGAKSHVVESLTEMVTKVAASYYRAGNQ